MDFDPRAPKLVIDGTATPRALETPEHRADVVRRALLKAGFTPKESRSGKLVSPEELPAERQAQRYAEIADAEKHLAELAKLPVPPLSETAKKIFEHRPGEPRKF
jgi:hypothetical protein